MSNPNSVAQALDSLLQATQSNSVKNSLNDQQKNMATEMCQKLISLLSAPNLSSMKSKRQAKISRKTKETQIEVEVNLDGTGSSEITTGIGFLDHMFTALAKHSLIDIKLTCQGDLEIDDHHSAEDCALALGTAFDQALGDRIGIIRFGSAYAPLDEALSRAVIDISGRPSSHINCTFSRPSIGTLSTEMIPHVLHSLAMNAKITLHVDLIKGENDHHKAESAFKAVAVALRQAKSIDITRQNEIPSTKGAI